MGLLSASLTALYVRDSSYLPSLPELPAIPRFPDPRALVSGKTVFFGLVCLIVVFILGMLYFLYFYFYFFLGGGTGFNHQTASLPFFI